MRARTTAAGAAALLTALTACSSGSSSDHKASPRPSAATAAPSASAPSIHLTFGQGYAWPDGLRVSVTGASVFTDYNKDAGEHPQPGFTDFRVTIRVANGGQAPADLGGLSVVVQGATTGGEAQSATFQNGSEPLQGQLAPGAVAFKNDDESLETKYGRRIVVRVQRVAQDPTGQTWPEFTGTIGG